MRRASQCLFAHVDMDAFYASIEILDDPSLQGKPVVVGGSASSRGVVAAASYVAREYGVRSAMPMAEALRRCPELVRVPVRMERYVEVSGRVMEVLDRFSPLVESLSLDEAFLDLTGTARSLGSPREIGLRIKREIRAETALTASVGIAPVKFVAKIASDLEKPDGLVVVPDDVAGFLAPLPIARLWGVGPTTRRRLERLGLTTIGDVARADRPGLTRALGLPGEHLIELALGHDPREVEPDRDAKSYSREVTFARDQIDPEVIHATLLDQAADVARRLRRDGVRAVTIQIKLRDPSFRTRTRQLTRADPMDSADEIYGAAVALLDDAWDGSPLRLVGVGVSGVRDASVETPSLFEEDPPRRKRRELDRAIDRLQERFGRRKIFRAGAMRRREVGDTGSALRKESE